MTAPLQSDVRVLVVSSDPLARGGLAGLLSAEIGVSLAGLASPSSFGLENAPSHDARAWDLGMDPRRGLEFFRDFGGSDIPSVALVHSDAEVAEAISAGARGVLSRHADGPTLAAALRATAQGLLVVGDSLAGSFFAMRGANEAPTRAHSSTDPSLSPREQEVVQLMAEGHPNKIIADRLGISDHTAKFHINSIFAKLGAQSRTEAVVRALRLGLLAL